jgi:hypothetical protein
LLSTSPKYRTVVTDGLDEARVNARIVRHEQVGRYGDDAEEKLWPRQRAKAMGVNTACSVEEM